MALAKITQVSGFGVHVPGDDVDTDQIIPARFLKCVTFDGLAGQAFYDLRFDEKGQSKNHPIDRVENVRATIMVSGSNFGCGSSREHAPQALYHGGVRAVIAESFAEIFFGNSTTLGLPCVRMTREKLAEFAAVVDAEGRAFAAQLATRGLTSGKDPEAVYQAASDLFSARPKIDIDLAAKVVRFQGREYPVEIAEGARQALLGGRWDALGELLEGVPAAQALLKQLPYANWAH
jgi:3-isopropylmalate/(R)-2-methylmalate dehydratase small subunit